MGVTICVWPRNFNNEAKCACFWVHVSQEKFRTECRSKFRLPFRRITSVMSPCGKCTVVMALYNNTPCQREYDYTLPASKL